MRGEYDNLEQGLPPVEEKSTRRRRDEFVVHQANWPKIQSTGRSIHKLFVDNIAV